MHGTCILTAVRMTCLMTCASPGRFFAANELKAIMAHLIVNYDVKLEQEGMRPLNKYFGLAVLPDPTAVVLFRKRRVT